jgi:RHS repeat-associated protein
MKNGIGKYNKHYYTGNHLSSTQLVTDGTGVAIQQVEYAPFGEVVNEYNIDWNSGQVPDFKFNGKELDEESGMYYFEARYQSPPVFISRDPLFEKYPTLSPYSYCANNPENAIDPDGRTIIPTNAFLASSYGKTYNKLSSNSIYQSIIKQYSTQNSPNLYLSSMSDLPNSYIPPHIDKFHGVTIRMANSEDVKTYYNNNLSQNEIGQVKTLLHEAIHVRDAGSQKNHNGFDRETLLKGLQEYNSTNNLGYSDDDLEIISWGGLQDSREFDNYIWSKVMARIDKRDKNDIGKMPNEIEQEVRKKFNEDYNKLTNE